MNLVKRKRRMKAWVNPDGGCSAIPHGEHLMRWEGNKSSQVKTLFAATRNETIVQKTDLIQFEMTLTQTLRDSPPTTEKLINVRIESGRTRNKWNSSKNERSKLDLCWQLTDNNYSRMAPPFGLKVYIWFCLSRRHCRNRRPHPQPMTTVAAKSPFVHQANHHPCNNFSSSNE